MILRRILPFLLVLLVHLLLLQQISAMRFQPTSKIDVVPIVLHETFAITQFTAAAPEPKKIPSLPRIKNVPVALPTLSESPVPSQKPAMPEASKMVEEIAQEAIEETPAVNIEPALTTQTAPALLTQPPQSARYLLDVIRTDPKVENPYYGSGEIHWKHDDKNYTMQIDVNVNILFTAIHLYNIQSEGTLGDTGIKPRMVTEKRRGRSATATHFNYDSHTVSFSASTATLPLVEGAQDKATVLMQLASIGNANPAQFQQGNEITIQVAEEKEANPFRFVVLNQEIIDTKLGHFMTWHIVRPPLPGSYSSRLDIWVAPELNWLPIQIRNTEFNGAITTQTIRKVITDQSDE